MADKPGHYWDLNECTWVRYDAERALPRVDVPAQPTSVEAEGATDVRSG